MAELNFFLKSHKSRIDAIYLSYLAFQIFFHLLLSKSQAQKALVEIC